MSIHKTAIVEEGAVIEEGCIIGPYSFISSKAKLRKNVTIMNNVIIYGDSEIGEGTKVFPFVTIGCIPQDLKYEGEDTKIVIGKNNSIREHVTIHLGTNQGVGVTTIGDNCLLMVGAHVAHDVVLGNNIVIANNVLIAGHVIIEDYSIIGGGTAIHQFCRIGENAFIGGMSGVGSDIVPFALFTGIRASEEINGVNLIGLRRRNYTKQQIHDIVDAYDILFSTKSTLKSNIEKIMNIYNDNPGVMKVMKFVNSEKTRNLCTKYRKDV
ncbi:Acyl-[acyl-carrier-protein]--UDP-N-acetylglucosamine O-acyltransferase [Candidatus Hepatincolaceae symbiont of Richtersius coronifer]